MGEVFDINDNPHSFYHSDEIQMPKGNYRFDIYGLKRKHPYSETDRENCNKNYAYLFAFRKDNNDSNENLERCDNETHIIVIFTVFPVFHSDNIHSITCFIFCCKNCSVRNFVTIQRFG